MNDAPLKRVDSYRDLGIIVDEKLSFKNHMESLVTACNSTMGFIKRTAGRFFDTETLVILYNTYVKSKLLFGIVIWYPQNQSDRDFIEGVQNRFTMMALKEWPNANINNHRIRPYHERCEILNIDSIRNKYIANSCAFIYDLLNCKLKSEFLKEKLVWNTSSRPTRNAIMLKIPTFTSNYMHNQSFWSAVRNFNETKTQYENSRNRKEYIRGIKNR